MDDKNLDFKKAIESMDKDIDLYNLKIQENQRKRLEIEQSICEIDMLIEKAKRIIESNNKKNEDYWIRTRDIDNHYKIMSKFLSDAKVNESVDNLLSKVGNLMADKINYESEFNKIKYSVSDLQKKKEALWQLKNKFNRLEECSKEILSQLEEFKSA
ncbi:uncharacterized protein LOC130669725 [Microplitis mediator]|uniref:uncharacterized protein LOC130669725 n=1 Tax=Microplitis mediator TaxID=375433 RepID=UPI002553B27C|nr:uncharacterized protein LOC130669725 [Microplitis mediator]